MNSEPTIFAGDSSDALARVYVALPRAGLPDDARLEGELIGPYCRYSKTLPARIRFADRGPGPSLLAEAIVPDPCYWTTDLPFLYKAELRAVAVKDADCIVPVAAVQRPFGIRRLGIEKTSIYLDARRFVPRGVFRRSIGFANLQESRAAASALCVVDPSDEMLQEASEEGVLLAVRPRAPDNSTQDYLALLENELTRLGRWPAVAIILLDGDIPAGKELRLAARGTLLAQQVAASRSFPALAPWAHLLWWQIDPGNAPTAAPPHDLPVIVYRPDSENATIEISRRACDRVQADLALLGDFAGYFV